MKHRKTLVFFFALLAAHLALDPPTHAQANITGSVRGSVADESGHFLPGASVTLSGQSVGPAGRTAPGTGRE